MLAVSTKPSHAALNILLGASYSNAVVTGVADPWPQHLIQSKIPPKRRRYFIRGQPIMMPKPKRGTIGPCKFAVQFILERGKKCPAAAAGVEWGMDGRCSLIRVLNCKLHTSSSPTEEGTEERERDTHRGSHHSFLPSILFLACRRLITLGRAEVFHPK